MTAKDQKLATLAILKQSQAPISPAAISDSLGNTVAARTLRRWLNQWVDDGILERVGDGRATRYGFCAVQVPPSTTLGFLSGLDPNLRESVLKQLRDLWTHNSTAIEGNTLTLGDTHFVLEEGLTISGKPLKDHQEVIGHAKAIELLYRSINEPLSETFLFELHKAVQTEIVTDIYKPIGVWKLEPNGTYAVTAEGKQVFIEYALPIHVPKLMSQLIETTNQINPADVTIHNAVDYYASIHIAIAHTHPFWDGNGRMARLVANLPLLKAGLPPLVIPRDRRRDYIQILAEHEMTVGQLDATTGLWPAPEQIKVFAAFCQEIYSITKHIVDEAFVLQAKRS